MNGVNEYASRTTSVAAPAAADWEALLRTIVTHPHDLRVRLVAADWLDEAGEAGLAEFIRLQCAGEDLQRQFELLVGGDHPPAWKEWCYAEARDGDGTPCRADGCGDVIIYPTPGVNQVVVPSESGPVKQKFVDGFVGEFHSPTIGWWVGEDCEPCRGSGVRQEVAGSRCPACDGPSVWRSGVHFDHERRCVSKGCGTCWEPGQTVRVKCNRCAGTGRTPGHGPAVVARHPVTKVVVSDRRPYMSPYASGVFGRDAWGWCDSDSGEADTSHIGKNLWARVAKDPRRITPGESVHFAWFPDEATAWDALSLVLVGLARERAGLPPLLMEVTT